MVLRNSCSRLTPVEAREDEDAPEAVGEFVGQLLVEVGSVAQAIFGHHELHQVADVDDEALHHLFPGPGPAMSRLLEFGEPGFQFHRSFGEGGEVHRWVEVFSSTGRSELMERCPRPCR